jgi:rhodanese-related sulfurtransferase
MQIKSIDPISLKKRLDEGSAILIDVREPHEHAREHIEGARLVPLSRFQAEDFGELRNKTAVFHCHSGGRTSSNARLLTSKGFRDAYHLGGGIMAWKAAGLPTRSKQATTAEGGRKRFGWLF